MGLDVVEIFIVPDTVGCHHCDVHGLARVCLLYEASLSGAFPFCKNMNIIWDNCGILEFLPHSAWLSKIRLRNLGLFTTFRMVIIYGVFSAGCSSGRYGNPAIWVKEGRILRNHFD